MAMASAAGPHRAAAPVAVTGGLAALPPPAAVVRRPPAPLPSLARLRCSDGFKLFLVSAALLSPRSATSPPHPWRPPSAPPTAPSQGKKVSYMFRRPSVSDIVYFREPTALQNCGINKDVVFIKRVIATPGDFIRVWQGQLIVNGVAQNITPHSMCRRTRWKPWSRDTCMPKLPWVITTTQTNDYTTGTGRGRPKVAWLLRVVDFLSYPLYSFERLPEGHVFVMGDNRNNSCDSRAWAPLPISNILGRYMMSFTRPSLQ